MISNIFFYKNISMYKTIPFASDLSAIEFILIEWYLANAQLLHSLNLVISDAVGYVEWNSKMFLKIDAKLESARYFFKMK